MSFKLLTLTDTSRVRLRRRFEEYYRSETITIKNNGCHIWNGAVVKRGPRRNTKDYGVVKITPPAPGKKAFQAYVHIIVNFLHNGTIPHKGFTDISHLCHNSLCVNIRHIVKEDHQVNIDRQKCNNTTECHGHTFNGNEYNDCII